MRPEPTGLALAVPGSIPLLFFFVCCVALGTLRVISGLALGTGCSVGIGLLVSIDCPGDPRAPCCPFSGNSWGVVGFVVVRGGTPVCTGTPSDPPPLCCPFPGNLLGAVGFGISPSPGFCGAGVGGCLCGRVIITQGTAGAQVSDGTMKGRITIWGGLVGADPAGGGMTGGIWGELGPWGCVLGPCCVAADGADDGGAAVAVDGRAGSEGGVGLKTLLTG